MIEPDPTLPWSPESLTVWYKVTANLERAGQWEEIFRPAGFVAASACANYLAACRAFGATADLARECEGLARWALAEMAYLDDDAPIVRDDLGRDLAIVCVTLEPA